MTYAENFPSTRAGSNGRFQPHHQQANEEKQIGEWIHRYCSRCKKFLPKCFFGNNSVIEDGRENNCASCVCKRERDRLAKEKKRRSQTHAA